MCALLASPLPSLSVIASSCMLPSPEKLDRGEDAFFIDSDPETGTLVTGVADGVGGWSLEGIDAGLYARELMDNARHASHTKDSRLNPKQLLTQAHQRMNVETKGSCTACIVVFDGDSLRYANLGDSGLFGYRAGMTKPFVRSQEQQHRWNCPFQLGHDTGDRPASAQDSTIQVQSGDIIILATDGFFDNLFNHRIMELVTQFLHEHQIRLDRMRAWPQSVDKSKVEANAQVTSANAATAAISSVAASAARPSSPTLSSRSIAQAAPTANLHTAPAAAVAASLSPSLDTAADTAATAAAATPTPALDKETLNRLAVFLVESASTAAADRRSETPFSQGAKKQGKRHRGGKQDDITVVVAQVLSTEQPTSEAKAKAAARAAE